MITRVRKLILEQPLPQYQVAAALPLHPHTLSQYALGRRPILPKHLVLFTRYFQVPVEQVLGYVNEPDILEWSEEFRAV